MTREEAINNIKELQDTYIKCRGEDEVIEVLIDSVDIEALDMAIKALEQEPILDKIRAEIEQLPTSKCTETYRIYINAGNYKEKVLEIFDKYKAESEE